MSKLKNPNEQWTCSMCFMQTHGEWDAESRPIDSKNEDDWLPLCKLCTIEVSKDFVADTGEEDVGSYCP